jgi:hypothetical protein
VLACDDDKERIGLLPFRHSQWINRRIRDQCTMERPSKEKMRILIYISAMRIFQKSSRVFGDSSELATKMGGKMPKPLIDSLLEQFTETPNGALK